MIQYLKREVACGKFGCCILLRTALTHNTCLYIVQIKREQLEVFLMFNFDIFFHLPSPLSARKCNKIYGSERKSSAVQGCVWVQGVSMFDVDVASGC